MVGEIAGLDRGTAELEELFRSPAVATEEGNLLRNTELARLPGNDSDVGLGAGDVDRVRLLALDRGELRPEIGVAFRVRFGGDDLSAHFCECAGEVLGQAQRVIALLVL